MAKNTIQKVKRQVGETSLVVQWLGICALAAKGLGSIPGRGTRILQAVRHGQKKKDKWEKILATKIAIPYARQSFYK